MKILYLAHRIPYPPNKGDKIRSFHEIRYFSGRHEIDLLAFSDQSGDRQYSRQLQQYCRSVTIVPLYSWAQRLRAACSMVTGKPWTLGYFSSPLMQKAVIQQLTERSHDLVFAYSSSMAPYAMLAEGIPKVIDFVDSDASKWRQYAETKAAPFKWLYGYESERLMEYEAQIIRSFDASIFVSRRESEHMPETLVEQKVRFVQNGVDFDYFSASRANPNSRSIVFTGAMDYFPNIEAVDFFAREVLPIVRSTIPDARFIIVGSNPSRQVRDLADLPGVTVTGTVVDVRPFLADSGVAVVPVKISQGIQNKILEALASGLPVVATDAALGGMSSLTDLPVASAGDARSFADRVTYFLNHPISQAQIEACRQSLRLSHEWDRNLSIFDRLFENIANHKVQ